MTSTEFLNFFSKFFIYILLNFQLCIRVLNIKIQFDFNFFLGVLKFKEKIIFSGF